MANRYNAGEIGDIKERARLAELYAPIGFMSCPNKHLVNICNGVGSDAAPKYLRDISTKFFRSIEATAAIHDFMYNLSDGSQRGRAAADDTFLLNGFKEVGYRYKWYDPRRYIARFKVFLAYDALRIGGNDAWQKCFNQKKGHL